MLQISQRLRGVKEDGEAIEEADFIPKLKKAFGDVGINIEDSNGELRSTFDILNDLAGKWDDLDSKQRQYLGEKAAGNRQVKVLNAIMANWDVVEDTINKANEATGAATEGNEKYLDSIQGRITAFQSAFQNLSRQLVDSDFVKGAVGLGTDILNFAANLDKAIPLVQTFVTSLFALKGSKITDVIDKLFQRQNMAMFPAGSFMGDIAGIASNIAALYTALTLLKGAYDAIDKKTNSLNKLQTAKDNYSESISKMQQLSDQIDQTKSQIQELQSAGSLSIVDEQELTRLKSVNAELQTQYAIQKNIAEVEKQKIQQNFSDYMSSLFGYGTGSWVGDIGLFFRKTGAEGLKSVLKGIYGIFGESERDQSIIESLDSSNFFDFGKSSFEKYEDGLSKAAEYADAIKAWREHMYDSLDLGNDNKDVDLLNQAREDKKYIDEYTKTAYDNLLPVISFYNELQTASQGVERNKQTEPFFAMIDSIGESINSIMANINGDEDSLFEQFNDILTNDSFKKLSDNLVNLAKSGELTVEAFEEATKSKIGNTFKKELDLIGVGSEYAVNKLNELYAQSEESTANSPKSNDVSAIISSNYLITDSYKTLTEAMTEQQKAGTISMATYQKLIESDAKLADSLELSANGYALNTDSVNEYIKTKTEEQKIQALMAYADQAKELEEFKAEREKLNQVLGFSNEIANQIAQNDSMQRNAEQNMEALSAYIRELDQAIGALSRFKAAQSSANADANFIESQKVHNVIEEGLKTGKIGTDDFQSAVNYVLGDNWRENLEQFGDSVEAAYKRANEISKRYSGQEDERTGANNFMKDVAEAGFGTYDSKTGALSLNKGVTLDQMAEKMKINKDYLIDMFNLLNTYADVGEGFEFPEFFTREEQEQTEARKKAIEDLGNAQEDVQKKIKKIDEEIDKAGKTGADTEDLKKRRAALEKNNEALKGKQEEIEGGTSLNVDTMTLEDAKVKIDQLYEIIQTLNGEGINIPVTIAEEYNALFTSFPELQSMTQQPINIDVTATDGVTGVVTDIDGALKGLEEKDHPANITATDNGTVSQVGSDINDLTSKEYNVNINAKSESLDEYMQFVKEQEDYFANQKPAPEPELLSSENNESSYFAGMPKAVDVPINADTSDMASQIDEAIPEEETVDINANVVNKTDGVNQPQNTESTNIVHEQIDSSAVDAYDPNDESALVKFTPEHSAVDSWTPPTKQGKVVYSVSGGLNAKGTRNAPNGTSLVDEKGAELIEHTRQGTFELGTNNGPRLTNLEAGDVVHTAAETKRIMSRMAKVGSFFRDGWNKAKSIISGGAFATGVTGKVSGILSQVTSSVRGDKKATSKSSGSSTKKITKWAEKLFDWAEIRLKRLKTITNSWLLSASEAIGYIAKNRELTGAIKSVEDEISSTAQAYQLYLDQAQTVAEKAKLSDDIIQKVKDGSIEISEYDKKIQENIKLFQTWYDKAMDCADALSELREQQRDLARQKLDNVIQHYDNRLQMIENTIKLRTAEIDLEVAQGREIQNFEYNKSIDETYKKLDMLLEKKTELDRELRDLMSQGLIEKESDDWFEYASKIKDLDIEIVQTKEDLIDIQDTINQLTMDKLGYQLDEIVNRGNRINGLLDLHSAQGVDETSDTYDSLIRNGMEQISMLQTENQELRRQQMGLDVLSEKYQNIESQIQSNISSIEQMKVEQERWNDSIVDLEIDRIKEYRDQIKDANDEFERQRDIQRATEDLYKARSQKTQKVYVEGQGFVYQADQDAIVDAQEKLEDLVKDQLIDRLDKIIDSLDDSKKNSNIYDAQGNLLGTQYSIPQLDSLTYLTSNSGTYASQIFSGMPNSTNNRRPDITNSNNNRNIEFSIGDINLQGVNNTDSLAESIVDMLPNAILQAINRK